MGYQSVVSGTIKLREVRFTENAVAQAKATIDAYLFDEVWPFTNIFWCDSPARYHGPVIGFAGVYKQVEEAWAEWLWKFSQLLSQLDATQATVFLDCFYGRFTWTLLPRYEYEARFRLKQGRPVPALPGSFVGQEWGMVEAPEKDFSIDPEWLAHVESTIEGYRWDRFVPRWMLKQDPRLSHWRTDVLGSDLS